MLNILSKTRLTHKLLFNKVNEKIRKYFNEAINEKQMFQFFESWLTINEKTVISLLKLIIPL